MKVKEIVETQLLPNLKSRLKKIGFTTSGNTWFFSGKCTFLFINLQYSTSNIGSDGKFTFNFGFAAKSYLAFVNGPDYLPKPKEVLFPGERRIGEILTGTDRWYKVQSERANEIHQAFTDTSETLIPLLLSLDEETKLQRFMKEHRKKTLEESKMDIYLTAMIDTKESAIKELEEYISSLSERAILARGNMEEFRKRIEEI